jgi:hypothetical protein
MGSTPATEPHHPHGDLHNPDVAHEAGDINIRAVLWFVGILIATALSIHLSMWGLFRVFARMEATADPEVSPLMVPAGQLPGEPRLQTTPWQDLRKFRESEDRHLHSYGWIDEKAGVAHVPIDKAKALLLQRGLAVRPTASDAAEGTHFAASGESSSGRSIPAGGADTSTPTPPAAQPPSPTPPGGSAPVPAKPPGGPGGNPEGAP